MSILNNSDLFGTTDIVTAEKINTIKSTIEDNLNGKFHGSAGNFPGDTDLDQTLISEKIRPGNFYGSPAPRGEFVSSDIHHRSSFSRSLPKAHRSWIDISQDWEPIPGLAITCHIAPQVPGNVVNANVMCNFGAREMGGSALSTATYSENKRFAIFGLWVKSNSEPPVYILNTLRQIDCATNYQYLWAQKNIAIQAVVQLQHGINHIYVASKNVLGTSDSTADRDEGARLTIQTRSIVVDCAYL